MTTIYWDAVEVGDILPTHQAGPITRWVLAMFAGGSGDSNPLHIDVDIAKRYGFEDVFAHGMLSMAFLAQQLLKWVPQDQIRGYSVRFASITPVHAKVHCAAKVVEKFERDGERRVKLELIASIGDGIETLQGEAEVALP